MTENLKIEVPDIYSDINKTLEIAEGPQRRPWWHNATQNLIKDIMS